MKNNDNKENMKNNNKKKSYKLYMNKKRWIFLTAFIVFALAVGMSINRFINITEQFPDLVFGLLFSIGGFLVSAAMSPSKEELIKDEAKDYIRGHKICNDVYQECGLDAAVALAERDLNAAMNRFCEYYDSKANYPTFHNDLSALTILFSDIDRCSSDLSSIRKLMDIFLDDDSNTAKKDCKKLKNTEKQLDNKGNQKLSSVLRNVKEAYNRRTEVFNILLKETEYEPALFNVMSGDLAKALQTLNEIKSFSLRNDSLRTHIQLTIDYLTACYNHSETIKATIAESLKTNGAIVVFEVMQGDVIKAIEDLKLIIDDSRKISEQK